MCLAKPGRIIELKNDKATVSYGGAKIAAVTTLTPKAKEGDYVLVHAGFTIEILEESDALKTLECFEEMEKAGE